ncbi:MAG: hypothetical protein NT062_36430 [Proteobacteria bacterium]|nr:hypothetical protein [Pseudomonadota bacterium]
MKSLYTALLFVSSVTACGIGIGDTAKTKGKPFLDAAVIVTPVDAVSDAAVVGTPDASNPPPLVIACFTEGNPTQTCSGVPCNFNNYNAYHDGYCSSTAPQTYGLETCDGPEDCAAGSHCCDVLTDTGDGYLVNISCQARACPTGVGNFEVCHPTGGPCSDATKHCVPTGTAGNYTIASNIYVCQ